MNAKDDPSVFDGAVIDIETVGAEDGGGGGGGGAGGGDDEDPPQEESVIAEARAKAQNAARNLSRLPTNLN